MSDNAKKTSLPAQTLKEDPKAGAPVPALPAWLKAYGLSACIGAGIVIVVIVSATAYRSQQNKSHEVAFQQLKAAKSIQAVEQVLAQYPTAPSAPDARLKLANERYHAGLFQESMADYDTFLSKYKEHTNTVAAELGRLLCLEASGRSSEALEGLAAFTNKYAAQLYIIPQAVFAKARCLQDMDRLPEARAVYEDFALANSNNAWAAQAESSIDVVDRLIREGKPVRTNAPANFQMPAFPAAPPAIPLGASDAAPAEATPAAPAAASPEPQKPAQPVQPAAPGK